MYHGLDELIWESSIQNETLDITFTKHLKVGDIPLLSLIVSKPSLLNGWRSVARHLPKASGWVAINLPWIFDEDVSITAISKTTGSTHWIQEILDIRGFSIPFKKIIPTHPSYISRIIDETLPPRKTTNNHIEDRDDSGSGLPGDTDNVILEPSASQISRPKKYIHIQSNSLSELNMVEVRPDYTEKKERPIIVESDEQTIGHDNSPSIDERSGHLSDNISSRLSPMEIEGIGVGIKESQDVPRWNGLEKFVEAMNQAAKNLGEETSLSWVIPGTVLTKPGQTGSRWFLRMRNDELRAWCLAKVSFHHHDFYFLEVGRDEDKRFSLSTVFVRDINLKDRCNNWIKKWLSTMVIGIETD